MKGTLMGDDGTQFDNIDSYGQPYLGLAGSNKKPILFCLKYLRYRSTLHGCYLDATWSFNVALFYFCFFLCRPKSFY